MVKDASLRGNDIILPVCAKEECPAGKDVQFYPDEDRHYYALHYVVQGNAALKINEEQEIALKSGDLFIIPPKMRVSYRTVNRCEYFWINIEGKQCMPMLKSIGLDEDNLVISYKRNMNVINTFNSIIDCYYTDNDMELKGKGYFYVLMGLLYDDIHKNAELYIKKNAAFYIKEAITFMEYNFYYSGISLDAIAKNLSINKNYLCTIFKKEVGVSPMKYLIDLRIKAACNRLAKTDEAIASVAKFVGYVDPLYFSKEFKKYVGISPSEYRQANYTAKVI